MQRKTKRWKFLGQPSGKGSHRYFRDVQGRISVADDSGKNPSYTDDGPLYLDTARSAEYTNALSVPAVAVPVVCGDAMDNDAYLDEVLKDDIHPFRGEGVVYVEPADFEWLIQNKLWKRTNLTLGRGARVTKKTSRIESLKARLSQLKAEAKILQSLVRE